MAYIGCGMAYRIWYGMYDVVWSIGSGIEYDKVYRMWYGKYIVCVMVYKVWYGIV